ncbi:MAG: PGN_0703 family putative restriction endonuclease [Terriglobales bacterium]
MPASAYFASLLRQELRERNMAFAAKHRVAHQLSYGEAPVVCYEPAGGAHGNFFRASYAEILKNDAWAKRLRKVHTSGRTSLPRNDRGFWAELDSSNSSDALLMNVFCYPKLFEDGRVLSLLGADFEAPKTKGPSARTNVLAWDDKFIQFGFRARVPLQGGRFDRTEVDLRIGDLLVEAKLTEADFQSREKKYVDAYRDFEEVFERRELPQSKERYLSYQLIRNVLAAQALGGSFCVLHDERRPDLREAWYSVMRCVKSHELRTRCKVLTWQELAGSVPLKLKAFLEEKYGISAI